MRLFALTVCIVAQVALAQTEPTCTLSGTVELRLDPSTASLTTVDQVVVFVTQKPFESRRDPNQSFDIAQKEIQFRPGIQVIQQYDLLQFPNLDSNAEHSVFAKRWNRNFFELPPSGQASDPQTVARVGPIRIQCDKHETMRADILVIPVRRFHAKVDKDGKWALTGLPRGKVKIAAWERNGGYSGPRSNDLSDVIIEGVELDACTSEPVHLTVVGKAEPVLLRKDGSSYGSYKNFK